MFAIQYSLTFCLYMRSLYETFILSFQYKYQAARYLNIGMSYSVIDGLVIIGVQILKLKISRYKSLRININFTFK